MLRILGTNWALVLFPEFTSDNLHGMPLLGQRQQRVQSLLRILELSPAVDTLAILFTEPLVPIDNRSQPNLSTGRDAGRVVVRFPNPLATGSWG